MLLAWSSMTGAMKRSGYSATFFMWCRAIKEFEGYREKAYQDPRGRLTAGYGGSDPEQIPKSQYLAVLSMLVRRATFLDKWRARRRPGHWLNQAKRELLIERGTTPR